jgi:hypothetical protein
VFAAASTEFRVDPAVPATSAAGEADAEGTLETEPIRIALATITILRRRDCSDATPVPVVCLRLIDSARSYLIDADLFSPLPIFGQIIYPIFG